MNDKKTRQKPEDARASILSAAFTLAQSKHYQQLTRDEIAAQAGISGPAVQYHFGTVERLRRAIVRAAVAREYLPVIAQAVMFSDRCVAGIDADLRARALATVS